MKILSCNEVPIEDVFLAFSEGFSDYIIKFDMKQEQFESHFFGPEANKLLFSYIAYDGDKPIGLVLGACKSYEGILTLRCGTMCVIPDYRGQGVARKLLAYHEKLARDLGCKQLFLECITSNDKALNFYIASGYQVVYQLKYYNRKKMKTLENEVEDAKLLDLKLYRDQVEGHVNWQNELWYLQDIKADVKLIKNESEVIGMMAYKGNRICYLHIKKKYRLNGYGKQLLHSFEENDIKISFPSQGGLEGFLIHNGFIQDAISQVEMFKYL